MRQSLIALVVILLLGPALVAAPPREPSGAAAPLFTAKPTASRTGDRVRIEFAVNRETDVAVAIEDAAGKVVRHLAAGLLGNNPPKPFKAGSLAQSLEWDGKGDYGFQVSGFRPERLLPRHLTPDT